MLLLGYIYFFWVNCDILLIVIRMNMLFLRGDDHGFLNQMGGFCQYVLL